MIGEQTVIFVWRCPPDCLGVYDGESLLFLYADGDYRYCTCGGRLVEGVASEGERRYGWSYQSASWALRCTDNWRN